MTIRAVVVVTILAVAALAFPGTAHAAPESEGDVVAAAAGTSDAGSPDLLVGQVTEQQWRGLLKAREKTLQRSPNALSSGELLLRVKSVELALLDRQPVNPKDLYELAFEVHRRGAASEVGATLVRRLWSKTPEDGALTPAAVQTIVLSAKGDAGVERTPAEILNGIVLSLNETTGPIVGARQLLDSVAAKAAADYGSDEHVRWVWTSTLVDIRLGQLARAKESLGLLTKLCDTERQRKSQALGTVLAQDGDIQRMQSQIDAKAAELAKLKDEGKGALESAVGETIKGMPGNAIGDAAAGGKKKTENPHTPSHTAEGVIVEGPVRIGFASKYGMLALSTVVLLVSVSGLYYFRHGTKGTRVGLTAVAAFSLAALSWNAAVIALQPDGGHKGLMFADVDLGDVVAEDSVNAHIRVSNFEKEQGEITLVQAECGCTTTREHFAVPGLSVVSVPLTVAVSKNPGEAKKKLRYRRDGDPTDYFVVIRYNSVNRPTAVNAAVGAGTKK